jgi:hypothetical protein
MFTILFLPVILQPAKLFLLKAPFFFGTGGGAAFFGATASLCCNKKIAKSLTDNFTPLLQ